jgi:uncharacterized protein YlxP (DUF503 family)
MTVATLRIELRVIQSQTQGDTRRQMRAIMAKLHRAFNVAVASAEPGKEPGAAVLMVATVAPTRRLARENLERVADVVAAHPRAEILGHAITEV